MKKFLCVCQAGIVRSGAMATAIKMDLHQEALQCGVAINSKETIDMLSNWADCIILMTPDFLKHIDPKHTSKVIVFDVGEDRWGNPMDPELYQMVQGFVKGLKIS